MIDLDKFTSDCANCAELCCLALAFDRGEHFAHAKAAGSPCHNLSKAHTGCSIHKDLTQKGYSGCVAYQCLGAGQRVTALFERTWRDDPQQTGPMMDAFRQMRAVQSTLQLIIAAKALPLPPHVEQTRHNWAVQLSPERWTLTALQAFEHEGVEGEIKTWLRSLAQFVQHRP